MMKTLKVIAISDTHAMHARMNHPVPDGDVIVHAGDITGKGAIEQVADFLQWYAKLPHQHKIIIAGNHDFGFEERPEEAKKLLEQFPSIIYLQDSGTIIDGVQFWGSPWQPWFHDWAFNLKTPAERKAKWDLIPEGTKVLITHGPPFGYGDSVAHGLSHIGLKRVGCEELLLAIERLDIPFHVCGHIHEDYGVRSDGQHTFINASTCNLMYSPVNPPVVFDIEVPE